jgi:hypothetical protein
MFAAISSVDLIDMRMVGTGTLDTAGQDTTLARSFVPRNHDVPLSSPERM